MLRNMHACWSDQKASMAGIRLLKGPEKDGTVGFVISDSGLKYLSTDLWN